ncbi:hypothetical protein ACF1Y1_000107 [Campylobacter coli]|nr:hypothetical protein [Campylobacter coli]EJU3818028.1 hypothetical protein [Campylobacter coli]EJV8916285.1 hypothetical protein [Campylobacter coli]ELN8889816.1 hypothetical protein [Campylobacter coli]ELQ0653969.1 hypothetical protein [Campylobacter coli]
MFIKALRVLFILSFIADLTIIGLFVGIPLFLILWGIQYIIYGEKNPFFVFAKHNPKPYQKEDIIDVEVKMKNQKKSLKTFLENWKD